MDDPESLYSAIVAEMEGLANAETAVKNRRWFKNADFNSYGLTTADLKRITHSIRKSIQRLSFPDRLILAEKLISSGIQEQASFANRVLALSAGQFDPSHLPYFDHYLDQVHSWATVDEFCTHVLPSLLLSHYQEVLPVLVGWSQAENRWKRRASAVAFVSKVGSSGKYTSDGLALCERLIWDKDDLVQKAVGWALKSLMRGAKEPVVEYVKNLRRRGVPSTITLYAIEELNGEERQEVLKVIPQEKPVADKKLFSGSEVK